MRSPGQPLASAVYRIPFDGDAGEIPTKETVGSKAHNLMRLAAGGLPVPPGFVLGTDICRDYLRQGAAALTGLGEVLDRELRELGARTGRRFGDAKRPLLVSVRSGAAVSMPGMMETVLNVGLNATTLRALTRMTGNPRLGQDCRCRLIQQYGEVVHAIPPARFDAQRDALIAAHGASEVGELDTRSLAAMGEAFDGAFEEATGERFPTDPLIQLHAAIEAVFRSWASARAQSYRKLNGIPDDLGTAATIQAMVFGNLGLASGSGVGFTRNPADGANAIYVDYLANAQGEDVVAGRRRAMDVSELARRAPEAYRVLGEARRTLEREFRDMEDFEFTVEDGRLFLLQTRTGKRTPLAALRIAHDLAEEGIISRSEALARIAGVDLDAIETVRLNLAGGQAAFAHGTAASAGVATGAAVFDPERVAAMKERGHAVVLVRESAETGDIAALSQAAALIAAEGARTSHAAVVARELGKVCIVGCERLAIDPSGQRAHFGDETVAEGDILTVDGATGDIYRGAVDVVRERPTALLAAMAAWRADEAERA
jgi:pyruvate, orthophosphate dikinase